ncbi:c-type cytochrome [Yoonia sediminilitoris]|uniref:Cytochrome c n=1 Tax=Yoonia sediminilitoris TaxID=1286148 RepID=A0A2T6KIU3_9RHOB|nr:cytochrome c [Yoonia sediminilitoris]PUB15645.1 cytochrome c [Yoonia sediminilitoris]RCW96254.1 cytochrome c [Yoonia sediminilitoris]
MKRLAITLSLLVSATTAFAQDAAVGRVLYETHCATCHGLDARGQGPMASVLLIQPTDLTQLTTKAGGTFPISGIIAKVDGRDTLLSHGSPMPVFGGFFEGKGVAMRGEEGILIMTSQPIIDLVTFLESIQAQPQ